MAQVNMIAAVGAYNHVIGLDNDLPWSKRLIPDLKRFKALTLASTVIMGRHTWESLPLKMRPLPERRNMVVSSTRTDIPEGVLVFQTLGEAIRFAQENFSEDIFIIGGAHMYEEGLAYADRLYITEVDEDVPGDVFFPDYSMFSNVIEEYVEPDFVPQLTYKTLERP